MAFFLHSEMAYSAMNPNEVTLRGLMAKRGKELDR